MEPCIEVVEYRQKKKGIKILGDLYSDIGVAVIGGTGIVILAIVLDRITQKSFTKVILTLGNIIDQILNH